MTNFRTAKYDDAGNGIDDPNELRASALTPPIQALVQSLQPSALERVAGPAISIWDLQLDTAGQTLDIPSPYYDGSTAELKSVVHPSIVYVPQGLGGYNYWIAFTPYPSSDSTKENPSIAASNDMVTWVVPTGVTNPLVAQPTSGATDYNADTHLYYHPADGYLYLLWRERRSSNGTNYLKGIRSNNGVNWSTPVTLRSGSTSSQDFGSCSFWHDGTQWVIVYHNLDGVNDPVERMVKTGNLLADWSAATITTVTIPNPEALLWWHSSFHRTASSRIIGVATDQAATGAGGGQCWMLQSDTNGASFVAKKISSYPKWYRSSLMLRGGSVTMIAGYLGQVGAPVWRFYLQPLLSGGKAVAKDVASAAATALGVNINHSSPLILADPFTGAAAALTAPWVQVDANTMDRNGSGGATNTNNNNCRAYTEAGITDYSVGVQISRAASAQMFLLFRYVDASNYWRIGVNADTAFLLQSVVAGNLSANYGLAPYPTTITYPRKLRVDCEGNFAAIYLDGLKVLTLDMAGVHATGTKVGISGSSAAGSVFDDFFLHRLG